MQNTLAQLVSRPPLLLVDVSPQGLLYTLQGRVVVYLCVVEELDFYCPPV